MKVVAARIGFTASMVFHAVLIAMVWTWQQSPDEAAMPADPVPVQLAMFAELPPAPAPAPAVESMTEPADEPPEPEPTPVEPPAKLPDVSKPDPAPEPTQQARPEQKRPEPAPTPKREPEPKPEKIAEHPQPQTPPTRPVQPAVAAAQTTTPAAPAATPRTAQQVSLREAYKAALLTAIERHKSYPNRARRRGIQGEVRIAFTVNADGTLHAIRLADSSGSDILDKAALSALRRLARVEPIPPSLDMQQWDFVVPITYRLDVGTL